MPVAAWKNRLYRLALPFAGLRVQGRVQSETKIPDNEIMQLETIFRRHHVVGGCLQLIKKGTLGPLITYGYAGLPNELVSADTVFRAASITKMVTAAGAMMLVEKGLLDLDTPVDTYLSFPVRNPHYPEKPITVRQLLSHTSSLWDGPGYDQALHSPTPLSGLVRDPENYLKSAPGEAFRYSNLAAGMVGSIMECVCSKSLESLMQDMVFQPLMMNASYTLKGLSGDKHVANIYRVLPAGTAPLFDAKKRAETADDLKSPSPEYHYLPAAGNLFTDAASLGRFICMMISGRGPLLSVESMKQMRMPVASYGKSAPHTRHCLGLVAVDDPALAAGRLYGHQGFAYGAAEGVFFSEFTGNGFVFLNSGASEARRGHLALVNRDLILWALGPGGGSAWM